MPIPHHKGLEHPWILVSTGGPETNPLWIPRDDCNHILFIHAYVDAHLGRFHPLAIVDNAAMRTGVRVSVSALLSVLLGIYQKGICYVTW